MELSLAQQILESARSCEIGDLLLKVADLMREEDSECKEALKVAHQLEAFAYWHKHNIDNREFAEYQSYGLPD